MKKSILSTFSLLLALLMVLGMLASCGNNQASTTTTNAETDAKETEGATETNGSTENTTDGSGDSEGSSGNDGSDTEKETSCTDAPPVSADGEHSNIINLNNSMANKVQAYFSDSKRTHFNLQNTEMTMSYARSTNNDQLVAYISNTKGNKYIENTMDVFIKMSDGSTFYASDSTKSAEANLYRFGYYYYQGLFEFQNFIPKNYEISGKEDINVIKPNVNKSRDVSFKKSSGDPGAIFTIKDTIDPWFIYDGFSFDTEQFNTLIITAKSDKIGALEIYFQTDADPKFTADKKTAWTLSTGDEFQTYMINLSSLKGYESNLTSLRFDPAGSVGDSITISEIALAKANLGDIPQDVSINRHFHVYSDKMHHAIQFATLKETTGVAEIGMVTNIPVSSVDKLLVIGENDAQYTSIEGIDWAKVQAVAFDIKDAGIFGYILPVHEAAGSIKVTLEGENYVVIQSRVPNNNTLIPSAGDKLDDYGNLTHADGVVNNGNDVYVAQRVYTDENHTFDEFIYETYCERNPIQDNFVKVSENFDMSSFGGYDPIRGIYILNIATPAGGFGTSINVPQKNYRVNFTITAGKDIDRDIYIMTAGRGSTLECAAILDADLMMLPIPIEVIKNFSEATGERNLFNISDPTFSEAIFMLSLKSGEKYEYNVLNLYQNWGKYPLKQLSQIPFHCPYYHLSTGVTETNCILPWFGTANVAKGTRNNTLPDFRSMSAPFWSNQPQHNSCGSHSWLEYTDADGKFSAVENTKDTITSYGPTYAEVVMDNISDDGKIAVSYTHMEMPQLDENRTYYTMEYTVLEDLTIKDFLHDFQFYGVTDNDAKGVYKRVGYLNENNESVVVSANEDVNEEPHYILGNECPYFSFYDMPDWNRESTSAEGYANVAFLVYNSSFIIGGEKVEPQFAIVNSKNHVRITLNLGEVTLKAGDKFTINSIVLPWGSQLLDGTYDEVEDNQVREVRRNTLLNPLTITSETDTVLKSPYLPKIRSNDGKTVQFTLSGGENNVTVRAYGFNKLTAPKVEELVNGEWVEYELNSANSPDDMGNYHYYDGYSVQFDTDGTYSYSFVTTMTNGEPRTFRLSAADDFTPWPKEIAPEGNEDYLDVYIDAEELSSNGIAFKHWFGSITLNDENGIAYTTFTGSGLEDKTEAYANIYSSSSSMESGKYFVIKYRVPSTNSGKTSFIEIYTSTINANAAAGDNFRITPIEDGKWHVAIVDISKSTAKTYVPDSEGKYYAQYIRLDVFNAFTPTDIALDIAYVGISSDLMEICKLNQDFVTVDYYEGSAKLDLDTLTALPYVKTYIDPSSGYTQSNELFASQLDYVNFIQGVSSSSDIVTYQATSSGLCEIYGYNALDNKTMNIKGWCAARNGITKYVWSADGGKTWNDFTNAPINAGDVILEVVQGRLQVTFDDVEASKKNGSFQGTAMEMDLSAYAGQEINITVGAIPESDTTGKSIMLMYHFVDVSVPQ